MKSLLNNDQIAVAASGIRTRKDIDKTKDANIWNFLIGESLVRAKHPKDFLESLYGK
jgi:indole-3-glycerol phosphate synthase